jgi:hypothetical protein
VLDLRSHAKPLNSLGYIFFVLTASLKLPGFILWVNRPQEGLEYVREARGSALPALSQTQFECLSGDKTRVDSSLFGLSYPQAEIALSKNI